MRQLCLSCLTAGILQSLAGVGIEGFLGHDRPSLRCWAFLYSTRTARFDVVESSISGYVNWQVQQNADGSDPYPDGTIIFVTDSGSPFSITTSDHTFAVSHCIGCNLISSFPIIRNYHFCVAHQKAAFLC